MIKKIASSRILKSASIIAKNFEDDVEEILLHAERVVKASLKPTDQVKALRMLEKKLDVEGLEVSFQKKITRDSMKRTAGVENLSEEEVVDLVETITKAVVDEIEKSLEDVDKICDDKLKEVLDDEKKATPAEKQELEAKLKGTFERKMNGLGVHAKLSRNQKQKLNVSLANNRILKRILTAKRK